LKKTGKNRDKDGNLVLGIPEVLELVGTNIQKIFTNWARVEKKPGYTIFAKPARKSHMIKTLEGAISVGVGDIICRGIKEEIWAQNKGDFERCYAATGNSDREWLEYKPKPGNYWLWAAQVTEEVEVQTSFGILLGNAGDYVIKETEAGSELPLRYWIIKQNIFSEVYNSTKYYESQ